MTNSSKAYLGGTFEDYKAIEITARKINYQEKKKSHLLMKPWVHLFIKDTFHLLCLCSFPPCQKIPLCIRINGPSQMKKNNHIIQGFPTPPVIYPDVP